MEEECLGRGKSTGKTPRPETTRHHQKTLSRRVLGERREVRVLGQGQRMRASCV